MQIMGKEITDIEQVRITKNTTAVVCVDALLHPDERKRYEEALAARFGCKVIVMDKTQQVYFTESRQTKAGVKKATPAALLELVDSCGLSERVRFQLQEWLSYKNYKYEAKGFEKLLTIVARKVAEFGEEAVSDVIDVSMSNMWAGICWERLKPTTPAARQPQTAGGGVFDRIDEAVNGLGSYGK